MAKIKACVVGLGNRGFGLIRDVLLKNEDIQIISVCDIYEDRIARAAQKIKEYGEEPKGFTDYREALSVKGLDAGFIFSDWSTHTEIAVYAMKKGIAVASEVGCEYTLENPVLSSLRTVNPTNSEVLKLICCLKGFISSV